MASYNSDSVLLNAPCEEVYGFLSDFRNLQSLMPEQVTNWQATESECSFTISGLANFSMELDSKAFCRNIHIVSKGDNPVSYSLDYFFRQKDRQCEVSVQLDAALSVFLQSVASRPLQNLVNIIAEKLQHTFQ